MDTILVLLNLFFAWLNGSLSYNFPKLWLKKILETWDICWEISMNKKKTKGHKDFRIWLVDRSWFCVNGTNVWVEIDICLGQTGLIRHYYFLSINKFFINVTFYTISCGRNYNTIPSVFFILCCIFLKNTDFFFLWKYTYNKVGSAFQSEVCHIPITVQWRIFFWFLILCWLLEMTTVETILESGLKV